MTDNKNNTGYFYLLSFLLVALDQVTKLTFKGFNIFGISHKGLPIGENIKVIGDFLQFTLVENAGMAFGITFGAGKIFLSLFSIFASIALVYYLWKLFKFSFWVRLGISLILAGAVGNLIDRVFYGVLFGTDPLFFGRVVDFILVDIPDINIFGLHYSHWPVFNIADSCVSCGVVILLVFHNKIPLFKQVFPGKTELLPDKNSSNVIDSDQGN
jgi:signal peptidase II